MLKSVIDGLLELKALAIASLKLSSSRCFLGLVNVRTLSRCSIFLAVCNSWVYFETLPDICLSLRLGILLQAN